jgi:hypothetical protein
MKTKLNFNRTSLFVAICLALTALAATVPAYARSTTGFNSFHILTPDSAYGCVGESWGAVVNNCKYPVTFVFETTVENDGWHTINAWDSPSGTGAFGCYAISFGENGKTQHYEGEAATFNEFGQESLNFSAFVNPGWSLSLYCWDVPPGRGISLLNWNP